MIEPTRIQPIYQGRVPAFVVIPFADFAREHPKKAEAKLRKATREKLAQAMDLNLEQLA